MGNISDILERIAQKRQDYLNYGFYQAEDDSFKIFFDLAQELDAPTDFYNLCVTIPLGFFNLQARLYLVTTRDNKFALVASTEPADASQTPPEIPDGACCYTESKSLVCRIRGKKLLLDQLPFTPVDDVIGLLEIYPADKFSPHRELFFEKFANRIGYNLHNRFLVEKNIEHLRFIRSLVADIEHNVIAPNIVYRLYLKTLDNAVSKAILVEEQLAKFRSAGGGSDGEIETILTQMAEVNRTLRSELSEMQKHHQNMSLFLETLLRRSHFDQGRLTLRTKRCNVYQDVLKPQMERFMERFKDAGIELDFRSSGLPETEVISVVDIGLIAQVYANLFTNALKYAREVETHSGKRKYVSYGYEVIRDFFGQGRHGLKYNVFSTGAHIPEAEREHIFEDQFRASNSEGVPGTGHGLAFIKNVVEIHGGKVGYEPTRLGNNFYFILPQ